MTTPMLRVHLHSSGFGGRSARTNEASRWLNVNEIRKSAVDCTIADWHS